MSDLRADIESAFENNRYPGDDRLTVYGLSPLEYDETRRLLLGCKWQNMPVEEFLSGDTPIPDLSTEAFHYYMPALLLASIDTSDDINSDVAHSVAFSLMPSNAYVTGEFGYDDREGFRERLALFNRQQRDVMARVVRKFIELDFETEHSVRETIEFLERVE